VIPGSSFTTFAGESEHFFSQLRGHFAPSARSSLPAQIITGNFFSGPNSSSLVAPVDVTLSSLLPNSYSSMTVAGWRSLYLEGFASPQASCVQCQSNSVNLASPRPMGFNAVTSHFFVRGSGVVNALGRNGSVSVTRKYTAEVAYADGGSGALSDSYALSMTITGEASGAWARAAAPALRVATCGIAIALVALSLHA
jgi:hypothetical protein